jgi:flagellar biosynthetic protein FliR
MTSMLLANPEAFLKAMLFAMLRVGGAFATAPIFAHLSMPVQIRILLAAAIAVAVVTTHPLPPIDLLSAAGLLAAAAEVAIGLALGFVLQLAFAAPMLAGEQIAAGAGLGFAAFADPMSGATTPAIGSAIRKPASNTKPPKPARSRQVCKVGSAWPGGRAV